MKPKSVFFLTVGLLAFYSIPPLILLIIAVISQGFAEMNTWVEPFAELVTGDPAIAFIATAVAAAAGPGGFAYLRRSEKEMRESTDHSDSAGRYSLALAIVILCVASLQFTDLLIVGLRKQWLIHWYQSGEFAVAESLRAWTSESFRASLALLGAVAGIRIQEGR